jgi:hypothetical protein
VEPWFDDLASLLFWKRQRTDSFQQGRRPRRRRCGRGGPQAAAVEVAAAVTVAVAVVVAVVAAAGHGGIGSSGGRVVRKDTLSRCCRPASLVSWC